MHRIVFFDEDRTHAVYHGVVIYHGSAKHKQSTGVAHTVLANAAEGLPWFGVSSRDIYM